MPYLICERCNGHYKLDEGESKEDFSTCSCGGNLRYADNFDGHIGSDNDGYESADDEIAENQIETPAEMRNLDSSIGMGRMIVLVSIFLFISVIAASTLTIHVPLSNNDQNNDQSNIGHNSQGYVYKYVYSDQTGREAKKVAVITGMHPREHLSKKVMTDLLKSYHVPPGWTVVQYDVNVLENPNDYTIGRNNGETLAASYILPDIVKSRYDLVVVCHDHEYGYGDGFYFATPKMDDNSVRFAESLKLSLSNFNYYKNNGNTEPGSSNIHFTDPIVSKGYKAIVYEVPEFTNYSEALTMSRQLLDTSIKNL